MVKASVGKRVVAHIIDGILGGAITLVLMMVAFVVFWIVSMIGVASQSIALIMTSFFMLFVVMFLLMLPMIVYAFIKDGLFGGRSVGKKLMGLKVVNVKDKRPCSVKDSILRNVTWMVPILSWIEMLMPFVDKDGLRFGDKLAGTRVE